MSKHVDSLIDDYVLGLSSQEESHLIEEHIATCARCFDALTAERERTKVLISSLREATLPPSGRIAAIWPQVAIAAGITLPGRRILAFNQCRTAVTTLVIAAFVVIGAMGTMRKFDGWMFSTYTPTLALQMGVPTASDTPSASHTPVMPATQTIALRQAVWGTPEPGNTEPQPRPNPSAPAPSY